MRAIRLRHPAGIGNLELADIPEPGEPGPGELLVRIRACSINYHDYSVVQGVLPSRDAIIPLSDGAGEVLAVGHGVDGFLPGDEVVSTFMWDWADGRELQYRPHEVPGDTIDGFACEMVRAPLRAFTHVPAGYSAAEAATLPCAAVTAWRALVPIGSVKAGDWVLVQGTGGVSVFALQFAKAMGARVIATSSSDAKLERMKSLGADALINYRRTPEWGSAARSIAGEGIDIVVEVGGAGTLAQSIAAVRHGGTIALIGVLAGREGAVPTAQLFSKQARLIGLTVGSRQHQLDMIRAIDAIALRPVIGETFELSELGDAFRYQEAGLHFGKIGIAI